MYRHSEIAEFEQENELLLNTQVFVGKISAAMNPVTYIIVNIALVVLLWTGANTDNHNAKDDDREQRDCHYENKRRFYVYRKRHNHCL